MYTFLRFIRADEVVTQLFAQDSPNPEGRRVLWSHSHRHQNWMSWWWVGHLMVLESPGRSHDGTMTVTWALWGIWWAHTCWDFTGTASSADSKQWVEQVRVQCLPLTPFEAKFKAWSSEAWLGCSASLSQKWTTGRKEIFAVLLLVDIWQTGAGPPWDNSLPVKAEIKLFMVEHFTTDFSGSRAGRSSRDYLYLLLNSMDSMEYEDG